MGDIYRADSVEVFPKMVYDCALTDQPLRWLAVLVLAPLLVWRGVVHEDIFVIIFGCGLFIVDSFCIAFVTPDVPRRNHEEFVTQYQA